MKKFQNFVFHQKLFKTGDGIIVGISGGPDSTALVLALKKLGQKMKLRLMLVHVNYGLRGDDSEKDEQFVRKFTSGHKLELKVIKYKPRSTKGGAEQILRDFRYGEFEKIREKNRYDWIAVAHNLDDQAETFFLNLLRGGGTKGLGAMREKRGKIIRPLLVFSRKEILGFLKGCRQGYRTDKTNKSPVFLRNKIRNKLIPYLEKNYLPSIKDRIFDVCENLRDDYFFLEQSGISAYNKVAVKRGNFVKIDAGKLQKLWRAEIKFVFRRAIEDVKGDLKDVKSKNFFEFEKILKSKKPKRQVIKFGKITIEAGKKDIVVRGK